MIETIINCLNINYGISAITLTVLPLVADIDASIYKAETYLNKSYFVKFKHKNYNDVSVIILNLLYNRW